jgi:hypothetical protein
MTLLVVGRVEVEHLRSTTTGCAGIRSPATITAWLARRFTGQVSFRTLWPGWYTGRAIHIQVRVRKLYSSGATIAGYTTQIFFSDADDAHVLTGAAPYNNRSPQTDPTTDETDTVLTDGDFATNIVRVKGSINHGYTAAFNIAADLAEVDAAGSVSRPTTGGGGGPGGPPPTGSAHS